MNQSLFLVLILSLIISCKCWSAIKFPNFSQKFIKSSLIATGTAYSLLFNGDVSSFNAVSLSPPAAMADARLNAPTAAGTRVNSDAESLLRYGLPIKNKSVRDIQGSIESIKANLKARRTNFAKGDLDNAKGLLNKYGERIIADMPYNHQVEGRASLDRLYGLISPLSESLSKELSTGTGSIQERASLDESFIRQDDLAKELSKFEQLLVPDDFKRAIPAEYADLPALQGRAVVDMVIKNADGSPYDVSGVLYDKVRVKLVLDGYNAPLTAGNFVDLVNRGFYNNKQITRSDGFVVQTGDADPENTAEDAVHGFIPPGQKTERKVPLEIALQGDDEILYGTTSEDDGRGYAAATLPFQSYGALGMARSEFESNSASSQFFWLLFESDLTPAGKNMLDGRYTCFGYTTEGAELLKGVTAGNIIESAKVISGGDKLQVPK